MPKQPLLTASAILSALTVASLGCSKAAPSATADKQATAAAAPAASIAPGAPPPTASPDELAAPTVAANKDVVDAGVEKKGVAPTPPARPAAQSGGRAKATGNANCGAGTCSDEMKKGK